MVIKKSPMRRLEEGGGNMEEELILMGLGAITAQLVILFFVVDPLGLENWLRRRK